MRGGPRWTRTTYFRAIGRSGPTLELGCVDRSATGNPLARSLSAWLAVAAILRPITFIAPATTFPLRRIAGQLQRSRFPGHDPDIELASRTLPSDALIACTSKDVALAVTRTYS